MRRARTRKRALSAEEQLERLRSLGMTVPEEAKAKEVLLDVGYYRLSFFMTPFQKSKKDKAFISGTTFDDVVDVYYFNFDLTQLLSYYLTRIEVNIRTRIIYQVSRFYLNDPYWFVNPQVVSSNFAENFKAKIYPDLKKMEAIKYHHQTHPGEQYAPAWKTIEFVSIGTLEVLYASLGNDELKRTIASDYGCSIGVFKNYLNKVREIRNNCAHGKCIYNLHFNESIKLQAAGVGFEDRYNIKGGIAVIEFLMRSISSNRANELKVSLIELLGRRRSDLSNSIIKNCSNLG